MKRDGTGRPRSYGVQPCCGSCEHVFVWHDYDEERQYFCHVDRSRKPRCDSVAMDEDLNYDRAQKVRVSKEASRRARRAWDAWARAHAVAREGCCLEYSERKEDA